MKVRIGPYGKYYNYNFLIKILKRIGLKEETIDKIDDWIFNSFIQDFFNWLNSIRERSVYVWIDPYDTWSMDHTLSLIIHPMLIQLRETKHGSCTVDDEDVPEYLRKSIVAHVKRYDYDDDPLVHEKWDWVLNEMIFTFECIKNDIDCVYIDGKEDYLHIDREKTKELEARIANGLRLFGKYYRGLWD